MAKDAPVGQLSVYFRKLIHKVGFFSTPNGGWSVVLVRILKNCLVVVFSSLSYKFSLASTAFCLLEVAFDRVERKERMSYSFYSEFSRFFFFWGGGGISCICLLFRG